jgi:hypothetical protein
MSRSEKLFIAISTGLVIPMTFILSMIIISLETGVPL